MLFDEASSGCRNRKSAISPASRARCLKPAPHDPRWTDLSGDLACASPPLHRCGGLGCVRRVGSRAGRSHPEPPVARGWRAGTVRLRLSGRGCACCTLSRPPPPIRTSKTPPERPSWIETRNIISYPHGKPRAQTCQNIGILFLTRSIGEITNSTSQDFNGRLARCDRTVIASTADRSDLRDTRGITPIVGRRQGF